MQVLDKLREIATLFGSHGIEDSAKEAETLIIEVCTISRSDLYAHNPPLSAEQSMLVDSLVSRRLSGEPLQYLIGQVEFCSLTIHVGPGVLIPRPETELLVEEATSSIARESDLGGVDWGGRAPPRILDLCTGSGCIALALARRFPDAFVCGIDRSERAIGYALGNASANGITNARFIVGDLFEPLGRRKFDYIVSNPPYIPHADIGHLQREIREYEPAEALDGGTDGLDFYRRILWAARDYLREGGQIFLEIGNGQKEAVEAAAMAGGFDDIGFLKDYSGIWRIFLAKWVRC